MEDSGILLKLIPEDPKGDGTNRAGLDILI